jgi:hypothetical protein
MIQKDGKKSKLFFAQRMYEYGFQKMRKKGRKSSSAVPK